MSYITLHNYEAYLLDYSEGNLSAEEIMQLKTFISAHPELAIDLDDQDLPLLLVEESPVDFKNTLKRQCDYLEDEELLNYFEGNLNPEQKKAFEVYLTQQTELSKKLELYKNTLLTPDTLEHFEAKINLHKTEEDAVLNNKFISYLEKNLNLTERVAFEKELSQNPTYQSELAVYAQAQLSPDTSITYPDKAALKKKNRIIALFSYRAMTSVAAAVFLIAALTVIFNAYRSHSFPKTEIAVNNTEEKPTSIILNKSDSMGSRAQKTTAYPSLGAKSITNYPENGLKTERKNNTDLNSDSTEINLPLTENPNTTLVKEEKLPSQIQIDEKQQLEKNEVVIAPVFPKNEQSVESELSRHTYLLALEESEEKEENMGKSTLKQGIWKRAVQLAKQVNKLGVKSIDGTENSENEFRLSFNSFSVEKK